MAAPNRFSWGWRPSIGIILVTVATLITLISIRCSTEESAPAVSPTTTTSANEESDSSTSATASDVAPTGNDPTTADLSPATLDRVVDGDTIDVVITDQVETVRIIGINAPENHECFAQDATDALAELLRSDQVWLLADRSDRDQYGRLLRYVWTNAAGEGPSVGEQLVAGGYAIARRYPPDTGHADRHDEAQRAAQELALGLWAPDACGPVTSGATIAIGELNYDAPGDDNQNLNGEWIDLINTGTERVDLTGWMLRDESTVHRFSFPSGFTLGPSEMVRVFSGCGPNSASELYWCSTHSAIWNNAGDTAFVLDPTGNVVASFTYTN